MIDWREYWEEYPRRFDDTDFLRHVSRTANGGIPIDETEIDIILDQLSAGLQLRRDDTYADLCCGNGLLTRRIADRCARVVGVDFSESMLEIARRHQGAGNIEYVHASVLDLGELFAPGEFTKIGLIESLHYLSPEQLELLFRAIDAVLAEGGIAYLVGVTDAERIFNFFNTPERRASYEQQKREGREIMGHWWSREELEAAGDTCGFAVELIDQDRRLNTAHYRFDVRLTRRSGG